MTDKTKGILIYCTMGIAIVLLFWSLYLSWFRDEQVVTPVDAEDIQIEEEISESPVEVITQESDIEVEEIDPSDTETFEEEQSDEQPKMEDFFGEKDTEITKQQALQFVETFHAFDASNPKQHIEGVKELVYSEVYEFFMKNEKTIVDSVYNVEGIQKRAVTSAQILENDRPYPLEIYWNVEVISTSKMTNGMTRKDKETYNVHFQQNVSGDYKISDFFLQKNPE